MSQGGYFDQPERQSVENYNESTVCKTKKFVGCVAEASNSLSTTSSENSDDRIVEVTETFSARPTGTRPSGKTNVETRVNRDREDGSQRRKSQIVTGWEMPDPEYLRKELRLRDVKLPLGFTAYEILNNSEDLVGEIVGTRFEWECDIITHDSTLSREGTRQSKFRFGLDGLFNYNDNAESSEASTRGRSRALHTSQSNRRQQRDAQSLKAEGQKYPISMTWSSNIDVLAAVISLMTYSIQLKIPKSEFSSQEFLKLLGSCEPIKVESRDNHYYSKPNIDTWNQVTLEASSLTSKDVVEPEPSDDQTKDIQVEDDTEEQGQLLQRHNTTPIFANGECINGVEVGGTGKSKPVTIETINSDIKTDNNICQSKVQATEPEKHKSNDIEEMPSLSSSDAEQSKRFPAAMVVSEKETEPAEKQKQPLHKRLQETEQYQQRDSSVLNSEAQPGSKGSVQEKGHQEAEPHQNQYSLVSMYRLWIERSTASIKVPFPDPKVHLPKPADGLNYRHSPVFGYSVSSFIR